MSTPTPQSERRRAARAAASFSVRLSNQPGAEPAVLRDISEIGLACTSPSKIAEMTMVGLDFSLPGQSQVHHIKGAVVRCEPHNQQKGKWDLAVYFTEVSQATRVALHNYVAKGRKV